MARTNNLTNFLTDVSSAIKQKTGDNTPIPASEFDTEILSIETGGNYQSKTLSITQNGNYNLLPDQEFDAISNVNISVSVSPVLQNKTVTENGSYTADQNYDGLGTVIVNVSQNSPIKLYNSREEMMADISEPDGEYGVIYTSRLQKAQEGDTILSLNCPDTVVLPTAITSSYSWYDDNFILSISLNSSRCNISYYSPNGSQSLRYTSTDGITYVYSTGSTTMEFSQPLVLISSGSTWNSNFSEFLVSGGMYFEGMYEWKNEKDNEWFDCITGWDINETNISTTNEELYLPQLTTLLDIFKDTEQITTSYIVVKDIGDNYYMQLTNNINNLVYNTSNNKMYYATQVATTYELYSLDLENQTYQYMGTYNKELHYNQGSSSYTAMLPYNDGTVVYISTNNISTISKFDGTTYTSGYYTKNNVNVGHVAFLTWHHVATEFDLEFPNQLAEGITALGKYGPITGDGSILNTIDWVDFLSNYRSNIDVLTLPSNLNGYHAERLSIPTTETIMLGGYDTRVLHDIPITSTDFYNNRIHITEHYILHISYNSGTYTTNIYDFAGSLVYTATGEEITKAIELSDTIIGYASVVYSGGTLTIIGKQLNVTTGVVDTVFNYTANVVANHWYLTKDSSNNLVCMCMLYNSSSSKYYLRCMSATTNYSTSEFTITEGSYPTASYTFDTVVFFDTDYYYVPINQTLNSVINNFSIIVLRKSDFNLIGIIQPALGLGSFIVADDLSVVYASFGTALYRLSGTTYTKIYDLPSTFGGQYGSHSGYITTDSENNMFLIGNGKIINLSTQASVLAISYSHTSNPSTNKGDVILEVYNDKTYISTHILDIHIASTGDNILLESEKRALLEGSSEYVLLENNAFSHLEVNE